MSFYLSGWGITNGALAVPAGCQGECSVAGRLRLPRSGGLGCFPCSPGEGGCGGGMNGFVSSEKKRKCARVTGWNLRISRGFSNIRRARGAPIFAFWRMLRGLVISRIPPLKAAHSTGMGYLPARLVRCSAGGRCFRYERAARARAAVPNRGRARRSARAAKKRSAARDGQEIGDARDWRGTCDGLVCCLFETARCSKWRGAGLWPEGGRDARPPLNWLAGGRGRPPPKPAPASWPKAGEAFQA